jgi:hypothetical protein
MRLLDVMKKKIVIFILIIVLALPIISFAAPDGFTVIKQGVVSLDGVMVQMRLRDLGYLSYRPTGKFGPLSVDAVKRFQANNDLQKDGQVGPTTFDILFEEGLDRSGLKNDLIVYGNSETGVSNNGDAVNWSVIDAAFPAGSTATLTDTKSRASFTIRRIDGENHAHIETVSEKDTNDFYDMFTKTADELTFLKSGRLTYEKRPCIIEISGKKYAASLFGYVHGDEPQYIADPNAPGEEVVEDNSMNGYLCLFFSGSTSDVFNLADSEHDANIRIASQQ